MKKGEVYEGIIEQIEFPNKGKVVVDGQTVIVKNGMPGQKVRFMINKKRGGRVEARLLEVTFFCRSAVFAAAVPFVVPVRSAFVP